jgi:hypothetical protein
LDAENRVGLSVTTTFVDSQSIKVYLQVYISPLASGIHSLKIQFLDLSNVASLEDACLPQFNVGDGPDERRRMVLGFAIAGFIRREDQISDLPHLPSTFVTDRIHPSTFSSLIAAESIRL